jgi:hypothetical protein
MAILIAFALIAAALGAYMRPRLLAVAVALGLAAGLRALLAFVAGLPPKTDDPAPWLVAAQGLLAQPAAGYLPLMAAAGGGAAFAALACLFIEDSPQRAFWLPQQGDVRTRDATGRYKRLASMVEERPIQSEAERRLREAAGD